MSKMTREQRLAAGWVERFAVRLHEHDNPEKVSYSSGALCDFVGPNHRETFRLRAMALRRASFFMSECEARLVKIWRRRKPKAPPPLRDGESVTIEAKIWPRRDDCPPGLVEVVTKGGCMVRVFPADITRGPSR